MMFSESQEKVVRGKRLCVRPAVESEFVDIAELRSHPMVAPFQYDPGPDYAGHLRKFWDLQQQHPEMHYGLFTITLDDQFVGSLTLVRYVRPWVVAVGACGIGIPMNAGWDLHPDYWGNGYMAQALTIVLDALFKQDEQLMICSECFSINVRCIGVLKKLGFQSVRMPWLAKLGIKFRLRCYHKHLRFQLTKSSYENRPMQCG